MKNTIKKAAKKPKKRLSPRAAFFKKLYSATNYDSAARTIYEKIDRCYAGLVFLPAFSGKFSDRGKLGVYEFMIWKAKQG